MKNNNTILYDTFIELLGEIVNGNPEMLTIDSINFFLNNLNSDFIISSKNESLILDFIGIWYKEIYTNLYYVIRNTSDFKSIHIGDLIISPKKYKKNEINKENNIISEKLKIMRLRNEKYEFIYEDIRVVLNSTLEKKTKIRNYIRISDFKDAERMNNLIIDNNEPIVIDIRSNRGGKLTDMFNIYEKINRGSKVYAERHNNYINIVSTKGNLKNRIYVLISRFTISSAEIFANLLKDSEGAVLVGEKTFGKNYITKSTKYFDLNIMYPNSKYLVFNKDILDTKPDLKIPHINELNICDIVKKIKDNYGGNL